MLKRFFIDGVVGWFNILPDRDCCCDDEVWYSSVVWEEDAKASIVFVDVANIFCKSQEICDFEEVFEEVFNKKVNAYY